MEIFLGVALAIVSPSLNGAVDDTVSLVGSFFALIFGFYIFAVIVFITRRLNTEELYSLEIFPRYNSLWLETGLETKLRKNHWTIMTTRKILFVFAVAAGYTSTGNQTLAITIILCLTSLYVIILGPYNSLRYKILVAVN